MGGKVWSLTFAGCLAGEGGEFEIELADRTGGPRSYIALLARVEGWQSRRAGLARPRRQPALIIAIAGAGQFSEPVATIGTGTGQ
jgi:hypothetical protein